MAAVYTVHTGLNRTFNSFYFPHMTIKNIRSGGQTLSASQIDCTPLDNQMSRENIELVPLSVFWL